MRGHAPIVAMRRSDRKPTEAVHLHLQPWPASTGDSDFDRWQRVDRVFVEPSDAIDRLDLRFLVGCDVVVHGSDAARVQRLYAALQRHKARRVIANCGRVEAGRGRLDFVLDSEEVLTWHA